MKSTNIHSRAYLLSGAAAIALSALIFAGEAQARDGITVSVGVDNTYPAYTQQPGFVPQQPIYSQPQQVYVQPQPYYGVDGQVIYGQPIYLQAPVYYGRHEGYERRGYYQRGREWKNGYFQYGRGERGERDEHGDDRHGGRQHDRD